MPEANNIFAPRVDRELTDYSWNAVMDFTETLSQLDRYFTPQEHDRIGAAILTASEVALSYRKSDPESLIRQPDSINWQRIIVDDMNSLPSFSTAITANVEDVRIAGTYGNKYITLVLTDSTLVNERRCAIESLKKVTDFSLRASVPYVIIGEINTKASPERFLSRARSLFRNGRFDIAQLKLNEGSVIENIETELF